MAHLVTVIGETASGKSALALELARQLGGEIICADASTLRRGADIGTAKPTAAERLAVPHHLLDIIGPDDKFTVAEFKKLALEAITDIRGRGKLPIMVGGSGLYVDSVIYDYSFKGKGVTADRHEMRPNTLVIGLRLEREELKQRVAARTDAMLAAGLEAEVRRLADQYGWDCEALRAIGYAEWQDYFAGGQSLGNTRQAIIKNTLGLAKKQRTWFRRNKSIQWFDTPVNLAQVVESMTTFLSR